MADLISVFVLIIFTCKECHVISNTWQVKGLRTAAHVIQETHSQRVPVIRSVPWGSTTCLRYQFGDIDTVIVDTVLLILSPRTCYIADG